MDTTAKQILNFWFDELKPEDWFNGGDHIDDLIKSRFADVYAQAVAGELNGWCEHTHESLAFILVIDQFSRNMFRNTPQMFANDFRALACVRHGLANGYLDNLQGSERLFFIMPFIHSENLDDQVLGVECLQKYCSDLPGYQSSKKFFDRHKEIIERFGRFPHRNKILGRQSSPEEESFLQEAFSSF